MRGYNCKGLYPVNICTVYMHAVLDKIVIRKKRIIYCTINFNLDMTMKRDYFFIEYIFVQGHKKFNRVPISNEVSSLHTKIQLNNLFKG